MEMAVIPINADIRTIHTFYSLQLSEVHYSLNSKWKKQKHISTITSDINSNLSDSPNDYIKYTFIQTVA